MDKSWQLYAWLIRRGVVQELEDLVAGKVTVREVAENFKVSVNEMRRVKHAYLQGKAYPQLLERVSKMEYDEANELFAQIVRKRRCIFPTDSDYYIFYALIEIFRFESPLEED